MTHVAAALSSAAVFAVLAACQPQTIEVEIPVTRIVEVPVETVVEKPVEVAVTRVVEKQVEVAVTRVVEKQVEVVVTRVVEKPVEVVITRLVEKPVEIVVTRLVGKPVETVVTQAPERPNVAPFGSASVSYGYESAPDAIDGDPESAWAARLYPVQSIQVILDRFYLVDRIEMVVAQSPAGETSHHGDIDGCIGILACWAHVRLAGCPAYLRLADLIPLARHLQPDRVAHDFTTAVSCSRFLLPLARDGGSQISGRGKERLASTHNHQ